jgi:mevalonate kinase
MPFQVQRMPATTTTAPGKIILFGEHAVVYGRPALAVPVSQVQARVVIAPNPRGAPGRVALVAPDVGLKADLTELSADQPLKQAVDQVCLALGVTHLPACTIRVTSSIPIAAGMGSGAAVSVALIRGLAAFLGHPLPDLRVAELAYEVEKLYHGTPSGIDNTVIAFGMPVFFVRGQPVQRLALPEPFTLVIGDTGIASPTAIAVGDVRRAWQSDPTHYEALFDIAGRISLAARQAIQAGRPQELGPLMDENHACLYEMGVSCPELDRLVGAARAAGALGAKLSGGGRGGNMIALAADAERAAVIAGALRASGAVNTLITTVQPVGI